MNDVAREKLRELVLKYGRDVAEDPNRCEALLKDLCPGEKKEIHALVHALKERVASELLASKTGLAKEVLLGRLAVRLEDSLALPPEAARWTVESWALALGLISYAELTPPSRTPRGAGPVAGIPSGTPTFPSAATFPPPAARQNATNSRTVWMLGSTLATVLLFASVTIGVVLNQQQQVNNVQRQYQAEQAKKDRENALAVTEANKRADEALKKAKEAQEQLAHLSGTAPSAVLPSPPSPTTPTEDPNAAARRLVDLAENRLEISAQMMKKHREARDPLEHRYGTNSPMLNQAYLGYPHADQIRAYDLMASEARTASDTAQHLSLDPNRRNLLANYFAAQSDTYREISGALTREKDQGYLASKPLWDAERKGVYLKAKALRDQVRTVFPSKGPG